MPLSAQLLQKAGAWLAADPYGGGNEYLKVVNDYDKQPTWLDRLGLLDLQISSNSYRSYMALCGDVGPKNGLRPAHKPT